MESKGNTYKLLTLKNLYLTIPFSLLVPTPSKAKFFNISQPMAPHPTYGREKYIRLNKIGDSTYQRAIS